MTKHEFRIEGDITYIYIIQKNGRRHEAIVDTEDWDWIQHYTLCVVPNRRGKFSVRITTINREQYALHRIIINAPENMQVDHIHDNPMDNRKKELRLASNTENQQNKYSCRVDSNSGVLGVSLHQQTGKWMAMVGKTYLGLFDILSDADLVVKAYRAKHMPFSKEARELNDL